jgi:hypothetical protein
MGINLREKLHQKVDQFSEEQLEILAKVADLVEQQSHQGYGDWSEHDWQKLALATLWEADEIDYNLGDAKEIYQ